MKNGMQKYRLGLGVIGLFVVVMVVVVVVQGVSARQDNQTYRKASAIAAKLNDYVDSNQKVPETLQEAGITDVPDTISYTKQSSSTYEFCATYKSAAPGMNVNDATSTLTNKAEQTYYGYGDSYSSYGATGSSSSYVAASLYLSGDYHAGKNCQTVKPYINTYTNNPSVCQYDSNASDYTKAINDYYDCLDGKSSSSSLLQTN